MDGSVNGGGQGNPQALDGEEAKKAFERCKEAAEQGNDEAQFNLGRAYRGGVGCGRDDAKALHWFEKAAENGNGMAQLMTGACYSEGRGCERSAEKAFRWFKEAAERGLRDLYENNVGTDFEDVARQNLANAEHNVGMCYRDGHGCEWNDEKAIYWFKKSAEHGLAAAQKSIADMDDGRRWHGGSWKSATFNVAACTKAAENGNAWAQFNLGIVYAMGMYVKSDREKSNLWSGRAFAAFTKLAEQDDPEGCDGVGACHGMGVGCKINVRKANWWFKKADALRQAAKGEKAAATV